MLYFLRATQVVHRDKRDNILTCAKARRVSDLKGKYQIKLSSHYYGLPRGQHLRCTEEVCVVCMMCTWGKKSKSLFPSYLFMAIVPVIDSLERERTLYYSTSKSCSKYDRKRDQTRGIIESIRRRRDTVHKFGHDNKGIQVA